jgi:hypothetical protein
VSCCFCCCCCCCFCCCCCCCCTTLTLAVHPVLSTLGEETVYLEVVSTCTHIQQDELPMLHLQSITHHTRTANMWLRT